jgi:1-phosphofructokinase family hexose kinase
VQSRSNPVAEMRQRSQLLVASPNLTLDRTVTIEELRPGEVLRFEEAVVTGGGKGVNVARAARALGTSALVVTLVPGRTGAAAVALLEEEALEVAGVPVEGEVRACSIVLERSGRVTVLNEPGPELQARRWEEYEGLVDGRLPSRGALVCSGSLPPGAPGDAYARLVRVARTHRVPAVVDAAGGQLAAALEAEPEVVTPNLAEAEGVLGRPSADGVQPPPGEARERAVAAARDLAERGPRSVVVTAGAAGVAFASGGSAAWLAAPAVTMRNPVGAGDAFAGGFAAALVRGAPETEAVRTGVAAAAASVESMLAGDLDPARAAALEPALAVEPA